MLNRGLIPRDGLAALFLLCGFQALGATDFQATPGDFNRDGRTDFAVLQGGDQVGPRIKYRLEVFSAGDLKPLVLDNFEAAWHSTIVARDIDGDHDPDLILFSAAGTATKVWINDGLGRLEAQVPSSGQCPESSTSLITA